jgi:soluble lytic murein transglycosylase
MMKRLIPILLLFLIIIGIGLFYFNRYWIHRYDSLITRQASIYRLDPDLVWSIIYEETYFRPWKVGAAGEVGLMQVTPAVGREWAAATGMHELERQMEKDPSGVVRDPERNIQIGCWYLEKLYEQYRDTPGAEARMIAGYNAGPSRVAEWNKNDAGGRQLTVDEFVARIDIPSTRAYVTSILERYNKLKNSKLRTIGNLMHQGSKQTELLMARRLSPRDDCRPTASLGSGF